MRSFSCFFLSVDIVNKEPAPKLRLKPGGFRRHEKLCVCHTKELLHRGRKERKGGGHLPALYCFLELSRAPDPSDKAKSLAHSGILDPEDLVEDKIL